MLIYFGIQWVESDFFGCAGIPPFPLDNPVGGRGKVCIHVPGSRGVGSGDQDVHEMGRQGMAHVFNK